MDRLEIINRVKKNVFDENNDTFEQETIIEYINECIDRIKQSITELGGLVYLKEDTDVPLILPPQYHHLLAVYSTARCFAQDERFYQGVSFMNEFETKLEEMKMKIENGEVVLPIDPNNPDDYGNYEVEYVVDNYFPKRNGVI